MSPSLFFIFCRGREIRRRLTVQKLTNEVSGTVGLKGSDLTFGGSFGAIATVVSFDRKNLVVDFDRGPIFPVVLGTTLNGEDTNGMVSDGAAGGGSMARKNGPERYP